MQDESIHTGENGLNGHHVPNHAEQEHKHEKGTVEMLQLPTVLASHTKRETAIVILV